MNNTCISFASIKACRYQDEVRSKCPQCRKQSTVHHISHRPAPMLWTSTTMMRHKANEKGAVCGKFWMRMFMYIHAYKTVVNERISTRASAPWLQDPYNVLWLEPPLSSSAAAFRSVTYPAVYSTAVRSAR